MCTLKRESRCRQIFNAALIADHLARNSKSMPGLVYRHHASDCHKLPFRNCSLNHITEAAPESSTTTSTTHLSSNGSPVFGLIFSTLATLFSNAWFLIASPLSSV